MTSAPASRPEAADAEALVVARVVPLWATRWLLARTVRAHLVVDGREEVVPWDVVVSRPVRTGLVEVEAYGRWARRRGREPAPTSTRRAVAERRARLRIRLEAGDETQVVFRQGWMSGAPFIPALAGRGQSWRFDPHAGCWVRNTR